MPVPDSAERTLLWSMTTLFQHHWTGEHDSEIDQEICHGVVVGRGDQFLSAQFQ